MAADMRWRAAFGRRRVLALLALAIVMVAATVVAMGRWTARAPALATADVTRGEYVDLVELRGEIKPRKSVVVTAPMQAGELQILKLAPNGSPVKAGDVVLQFDRSTVQRTIKELESALRQATEELDQAKSQANITTGQDNTELLHSRYEVDRARLDVTEDGIVSKMDAEKAKLAVADAEQRLRESAVKEGANRGASVSAFATQESKIAKVRTDLQRAERALAALEVKAPADGVVSILPNYRASSPMGSAQEFRVGDRAWAGAQVLQLPDLTSVHLAARLDESDRGRLQQGQGATVRVDAIPDHEYRAQVTELSVLARVDFSSGWPPMKNFDLTLTFRDPDQRLRPGMSAVARIAVGRLPDVLLVPAQAVFLVDGRAVVYRLERRAFAPVAVDVIKRGKEQAAVTGPLRPGDRIALTKPDAAGLAGSS
jgi:multidrug efflux pump subunit AcrA (membrane-fusion protein)